MNNSQDPRPWNRLLAAWQTLVAIVLGLATVALALSVYQLRAPDAPVVLYWVALGAGIALTALHTPRWFRPLHFRIRQVVYGATVLFILLLSSTTSQLGAAWDETPQGAQEARERDAERERAASIAAIERTADEAATAGEELERKASQLDKCFTYFGHRLPALEDAVRDRLHNPHSFEHVRTEASFSHATMNFRAENGFGALREYEVEATINPDDCHVEDISEPTAL